MSDHSKSRSLQGSPERVLDIDVALERVEGDRDLFKNLLEIFFEESRSNIKGIREAFDARDVSLLERLAHTVNGSAANVGANAVSKAASVLEKQAGTGDLESSTELIAALEREAGRFVAASMRFLTEEGHSGPAEEIGRQENASPALLRNRQRKSCP